MATPDLSRVPEEVEKTEQRLVWFIRNVIRGSWFRRLVFLFVIFQVFANPPVVTQIVSLLQGHTPSSYGGFYWVVTFLLLLVALIVAIKTVPRLPMVTTPSIDAGAVRGLLPFNLQDSELFARLERGVELQRVLAALHDASFRLGILVGGSGTGKTSFLRAGILAQLRREKVPATYVELSNEDPLISIRREVVQQGQSEPMGVLLLDQFEQFFLHQRTAEDRNPLIDTLGRWCRRDSVVKVLVCIRAEDLSQMIEIQERLDYKLSNQNLFKLSKFSVEQAVNVLAILCDKAGIAFDPAFARRIVDHDLRDDPEDSLISPVNLGILILVMATRRHAFNPESFKAYGGIDGLMETWLDSQLEASKYQGLEKPAIRTLSALCDFNRNRRSGILTIDAIADQLAGDVTRNQVERATQWLARPDVRLAVRLEKPGAIGYQLGHERMIPAIRKAAGKLLDDAARANQLLDRRVREWVNNDRSSRFLLPLIEYWQVERQRTYLMWDDSRSDKEVLLKQSRQRLQRRAVLPLLAGLMLLGGYVGWCSNAVQRHYTERELSRLANSDPSEDAVHALVAAEDWSSAMDVANRLNDFKSFDTVHVRVAEEMAKAGLANKDQKLFEQALQAAQKFESGRTMALAYIADETAKAGLTNKDQLLVKQALDIAEVLGPGDRIKVLQQVAVEMANAGRRTDQPDGSCLGWSVCLPDQAKQVLERAAQMAGQLSDYDRSIALRNIAVDMAKAGLASDNEMLMGIALKMAESLGPNDGTTTHYLIALEMAKALSHSRNKELLDQTLYVVQKLDPTYGSRTSVLLKIAQTLEKDRLWREVGMVFEAAVREADELPKNRPHVLLEIAEEMIRAEEASNDQKLLRQTLNVVRKLDPKDHLKPLEMIAEDMAKAGLTNKDQNLLKEALQVAETVDAKSRPLVLQRIALDMTKAGLVDRDRRQVETALQIVGRPERFESMESLKQIVLEMATAALADRDRELLERALQIAETLEPTELASSLYSHVTARAQIAEKIMIAGLARGDRALVEQALHVAETINPDARTRLLATIGEEMAKAGMDQALQVAEKLDPDTRAPFLAKSAQELAKAALATNDQKLLEQALQVAEALSPDARIEVLGQIVDDMVEAAPPRRSQKLVEQALQVAEKVDPPVHNLLLQRTAVAMAKVGLGIRDQKLVERALQIAENLDRSNHDEGLQQISSEIARTGLDGKDEKLIEQALRVAERLDPIPRRDLLFQIAKMMGKAGLSKRAKSLLERVWQETRDLHSPAFRFKEIAVEMVRLGYLKLAREIAESTTEGSVNVVDVLAAVVLTDIEVLRSSRH